MLYLYLAFILALPFSLHAEDALAKIDWTGDYVRATEQSCGHFQFSGIEDGKSYTFIVRGKQGGKCIFQHENVTFRYPSFYAPAPAGYQAVFSFVRQGDDVFVAYTDRY